MKWSCLLALCAVSASCFAAEEVIAKWDFSTGSIHSTDGKYQATLRGSTQIAGEGKDRVLAVGLSSREKPEGILLRQKYEALSPKGAFGMSATFRMREQTSAEPYEMIWDSKYINYGLNDAKPNWHKGFVFYFSRNKDGKWTPQLMLGHGEYSSMYVGVPAAFEEGKKYSASFEYDGVNTVTFKVDGKVNAVRKAAKAGDIVPAYFPISIGDRSGSNFNRFDGELFDVTLFKITK